jgi:fluoride exporter
MTLLLVALGAAVGAPLRYLTDRLVQSWHDSLFPWGTWAVNVAGSFVLGLLVAGSVSGPAMAMLGTGFCGALTTYSTFSYETVRLAEEGAWRQVVANVAGSLVAGIGAAVCGAALAVAARS